MKLDRNINGTGRGKYGLIKTRAIQELKALADGHSPNAATAQLRMNLYIEATSAIAKLEDLGVLDWGPEGTESEFFVIKLRDEYANPALREYAWAVIERGGDREYAKEVAELSYRSGTQSPFCKKPD